MSTIEKYVIPTDLAEAVRLLAEHDATLLAGGTDLMPRTRTGGMATAPLLVNLRKIPELRGITTVDQRIRIGALTTVTEILRDRTLRQAAAILPETADCFASDQVRNSATIGGNICNASPAGDLIIPLLLLDAELELASWVDGAVVRSSLPLSDFFVGPGQTRLAATEILLAATFALPPPERVAYFEKFGARPALDISIVSVGIAGTRQNGSLHQVRVAFGAVAPTPLRGRQTEAFIEGQVYSEQFIGQAGRLAAEEVSPITDVRATAWYRREMIRILTGRVLRHVLQTAY
ncbi:MAG: xanthine dehydrogenase family protein subunit M [bacterium]